MALQMIDGTLTFTVNNGREPITAVFKPEDVFSFCDGQWHEVHGKDSNTKAMMQGESILDPCRMLEVQDELGD